MRLGGDGCGNPDGLGRDVRGSETAASQVERAVRSLPGVRLTGMEGCDMRGDESGRDSGAAKLAWRGLGGTWGGLEGVACTDE